MLTAPIPEDEATRLALLKACRIMYTPAEQAFDDVARLAADICGTEIALITLVDSDRQWFKARVGVTQTETARDLSFCGHCITDRHPLVVEDTLMDPRFADNPLVVGDPFLRFYAGVPLQVEPGSAVGALSVADRAPRRLTPRQLESLRRLAEQISRELRLRRDLERISSRPQAACGVGPGSVVGGRWRIEAELGRGSAGAVFKARDAQGAQVAIKLLLPEWRTQEHLLQRFVREARVLMRLKTPHVGKLLDVGNLDAEQGDLPYLVLEYLEGEDLDRLIRRQGKVPFRNAFAWCADACDGLAEAHELGVVHRDLKPSNVFLAQTPGAVQVKVIDFGIAAGEPSADAPPALTRVEQLLGTPAYMSPEQMLASHEVDARTDVWSMGVLLYELVSGRLPFPGNSDLETLAATLTREPMPLDDAPTSVLPVTAQDVILTCLQKPREERYKSMRELSGALRSASAATLQDG